MKLIITILVLLTLLLTIEYNKQTKETCLSNKDTTVKCVRLYTGAEYKGLINEK